MTKLLHYWIVRTKQYEGINTLYQFKTWISLIFLQSRDTDSNVKNWEGIQDVARNLNDIISKPEVSKYLEKPFMLVP